MPAKPPKGTKGTGLTDGDTPAAELTDAFGAYDRCASELSHLIKKTVKKLNQFRRHKDWGAAFNVVRNRHPELFITLDDGRRALTDESLTKLFDLADEEFIEQIIIAIRIDELMKRAPEAVS